MVDSCISNSSTESPVVVSDNDNGNDNANDKDSQPLQNSTSSGGWFSGFWN